MDTRLTEEQQQLRKTVGAFAREVVAPVAAHHDETKTSRSSRRTPPGTAGRTAPTQVHGGHGFMNAYPVARHYRDSKILEVGEGTTEVQLMLIARTLGL